ncbi:BQ2448_8077 [Microbotryum intermedium]|uniref:BQ2448_8077 protein n=1 Tax=Microbotryum intermedium TaxID=269621 RepID=A0A238FT78_9BASI|nr:BQ2448_8077 [Microbotryum intermedium]
MLPSILAALLSLALLARCNTELLTTLHMHDSEHATNGLVHPAWFQDRKILESVDLSLALDLQDVEFLAWAGEKDESGLSLLATMDVETYKHEKIINMQRFSKLLAGFECGASQISIVFQSKRAFDHALQDWSSWVQAEPDHVIVLFANWKGCLTPEGNLKPFHFHDLSSDAVRLEITLHGVETDWKTATHTSTLAIGLPPGTTADDLIEHPKAKRSWFKKARKFFKKLFNLTIKTKPLSISLDHRQTIIHTHAPPNPNGLHSIMVCSDCGSHGSIEMNFVFKIVMGIPHPPYIAVHTRNVGMKVKLGINAKASIPASFGWGDTIYKTGVPRLSCAIKGVVDMGFYITLGWGYSISGLTGHLQVQKTIDFGVNDMAGVDLYLGPRGILPNPTGRWGITHTSTPLSVTGLGSGTFSAGLNVALSLKIDLHNLFFISPVSLSVGAGPSIIVGIAGPRLGPCSALARSSGHTLFVQPKIAVSASVGASIGASLWGFSIPIEHPWGKQAVNDVSDDDSTASDIPSSNDTSFERADKPMIGRMDPNPFPRGLNDSEFAGLGASLTLVKWSTDVGPPICYHTPHKRDTVQRTHPRDLLAPTTYALSSKALLLDVDAAE